MQSLKSEDVVYRNRFRTRRFSQFMTIAEDVIRDKGSCSIIDIGGAAAYWHGMSALWQGRPIKVTIVNLKSEAVPNEQFSSVVGNACNLPEFADNSFDLVHSNSVIEHVGRWNEKLRMANEVRRLARRYFVQTPNYWFPFEPHFRAPFMQFLPEPWRLSLVQRFKVGFYPRAANVAEAHAVLEDATLLDAQTMRALFPDAEIQRERFLLLTKSLIAVRK